MRLRKLQGLLVGGRCAPRRSRKTGKAEAVQRGYCWAPRGRMGMFLDEMRARMTVLEPADGRSPQRIAALKSQRAKRSMQLTAFAATTSLVDYGAAVELLERRMAPGVHGFGHHDGAVLGIAPLAPDMAPAAVRVELGGQGLELLFGEVAVAALDAAPFVLRDHLPGHGGLLPSAGHVRPAPLSVDYLRGLMRQISPPT